MRRTLARPGNRHGTAAVEFALVAPMFFLVVLAIFEFGWAMFAKTLLTNAAREGSHAGALDGATVSDVTGAVNDYLHSAGLPDATTTVSPNPPSLAVAGQNVTVTINVPYGQVSLLPTPPWLGNAVLTASASMRRETSR